MASTSEIISQEIAEIDFNGSHNSNLEEKYTALWDSLLVQNVPREQIAKKGHELIEIQLKKLHKQKGLEDGKVKFNNDSWYYELAAKNRFTPKTASSPATDNTNSSDEKTFDENSPFYEQRYDDIILIQKMKKFLSMIEDELEKDYDEVREGDTITEVERDWSQFYDKDRVEFHEFMKNLFANFFDEWSRQLSTKQSLLPKMWIVSAAIMGCGVGISDFCSNYFALVKNKTKISTKAWRKFVSEINNFSEFMHFIQDDAWKWTVLPIPCPKCQKKTLRTKIYPNGSWEFVCANKKAHKNEPQPHFTPNLFRKMVEKYMKNSNKIGQKLVDEVGIDIITNDPVKQ